MTTNKITKKITSEFKLAEQIYAKKEKIVEEIINDFSKLNTKKIYHDETKKVDISEYGGLKSW